jgi:hypothetical protein
MGARWQQETCLPFRALSAASFDDWVWMLERAGDSDSAGTREIVGTTLKWIDGLLWW